MESTTKIDKLVVTREINNPLLETSSVRTEQQRAQNNVYFMFIENIKSDKCKFRNKFHKAGFWVATAFL